MPLLELLFLASIWGASFLFLKVGASAFGPIALICLRVGVAAALLLPVMARPALRQQFIRHLGPLALVGLTNSALPFLLFAYGALQLGAGTESILNATTPMFTALVAWLWLKAPVTRAQGAGMAIGLVGVAALVAGRPEGQAAASPWAYLLPLGATLCYGVAANVAARRLRGVDAKVVTFGCMFFATVMLLPLLPFAWPAATPSLPAWGAALLLGALCTGFGYILYFRLLAQAGAPFAASVTFVVPIFGMIWGRLFLDEPITVAMLAACAVILLGTALTSGRLRWPRRAPPVA
ncbi:DMT family transporter [Chitinasiproducens palmae]|uniref:Permease of the drug/metabolite transporter (DMT) superfamily n=1 Tax=Chitinasiproducens palmae TaxID=1770053 RepID=A0A1H2PQ25_9BURK|nr:DMT family transporter [Chitinasiproducens palmae]SDV48444.1 Permease of the drug/metabolite transporter (DMT) superfamily [Chitinasiproducens palmae]